MRKFLYLVLFTIAWLHTPVATAITAGIRTDQKDNTDTTHSKGYKTLEAQTQQWFFRPKLVTGMSHLKFEDGGSLEGFKWSDNLPFVGIGGAVHYGKLAAELYAQVSDKGQDDYFDRLITSKNFTSGSTVVDYTEDKTTIYDADFRRTEYSGLLSYEIIEGLSIFGSYKIAELKINRRETRQIRTETKTTINNVETDPRKTQGNIESKIVKTNFTTKGPALGFAYNYSLNDDIGLGVSFAYGWLEGTLTEGSNQLEPQPTAGQAYGINFTHRLPQHHLKYILSLENYGYTMDVNEAERSAFQITENVTSFKATLVWEF